jgi:hypothetical protein
MKQYESKEQNQWDFSYGFYKAAEYNFFKS